MNNAPTESDHITGDTLTMVRVFDAPRDLVFDAWTDAEALATWWGPTWVDVPRETVRVVARVGGEWTATMVGADGEEFPSRSVFTVFDRPNRLELAASPESAFPSTLTVTFEEAAGKTVMTVANTVFTQHPDFSGMTTGWSSAFTKLRASLTKVHQ